MLLPRKKLKVEVEVKESEVTERGESAHTEVSPSTDTPTATILRVEKIFQDQWLVVVNKPSGYNPIHF
jgi:23S rRNA-/tRNA-specific pseudouridylate synthase